MNKRFYTIILQPEYTVCIEDKIEQEDEKNERDKKNKKRKENKKLLP